MIDLDHADIRFGHIRVDLHFGEIIRDREDDRRLQTGRNRLSNIDIARNNNAIDRRRNRAMLEIGLRFIERALFDFHVGFGLMKGRRRLIDVSLRRSFLCKQFLCSRLAFTFASSSAAWALAKSPSACVTVA